jgi:hypothetical protein
MTVSIAYITRIRAKIDKHNDEVDSHLQEKVAMIFSDTQIIQEKITETRKKLAAHALDNAKLEIAILNRNKLSPHEGSPIFGKFILCLFLPLEKTEDRLGDFEERYNKTWSKLFGPRVGQLIYIMKALGSAGAIIRIGVIAYIVDRVRRAFGF